MRQGARLWLAVPDWGIVRFHLFLYFVHGAAGFAKPKSASTGPLQAQKDEFNASTILESDDNPGSNFPGIHGQALVNLLIGWLGVGWEFGSGPNCQGL